MMSRKLEKDMRDHKNVVDNMKKERILISNFETRCNFKFWVHERCNKSMS